LALFARRSFTWERDPVYATKACDSMRCWSVRAVGRVTSRTRGGLSLDEASLDDASARSVAMIFSLRLLVRLAPLALIPLLSGCVWVAATGAVAGVSAARQERTIGNAISDTAIKATLDTHLAREAPGVFVRVSTTVVEGRVLLAGRVDKPETRLEATRVAWG